MNYGHLIKRPFEIVARRPYLWLLGFLAGGATASNFSSGGTNYTQSSTYSGPSWAAVQNTWNGNWEWIVGILAFFVVVGVVLFILGCIATGGIIHAAVEHDAGHDYKLGTAWRAGYATGWRIAGLRLLTFLLAFVPGLLVGTLVLATVVAAIAWLPASWIAAVATFFAGLPGARVPWPTGVLGILLLSLLTVAGLVAALGGVPHPVRRAARAVLLVAFVGYLAALGGSQLVENVTRPADWEFALCDIGQGDATVIRSQGAVALDDTGPDPARLQHCLDELGITHIDLLVLTHYDLDHVGGTSAVFGMVDRALVGPSDGADDDRLAARLAGAGASVERAAKGMTGELGDLSWSILWPRLPLGGTEPGNDAPAATVTAYRTA